MMRINWEDINMNKKKSLIITSVVCILPLIAGGIMLGKLPEMLPVQWANDGTVSNYAPTLRTSIRRL